MTATTQEEFCKLVTKHATAFAEEAWKALVKQGAGDRADDWMRVHGGELLRRILGEALSARADKVEGPSTCKCGGLVQFRQHRPFELHTVLPGRDVDVTVRYAQCRECGIGVVPLVSEMRVDPEGFTLSLCELSLLAGVMEPYERAATELLQRFAAVDVSKDKIQSLVAKEGPRAEKFLQEEKPLPESAPKDEKESPLYVEIDGGMIFVDKRWQEVKLGLVFRAEDRAEISKDRAVLLAKQVVAVRGDPQALGKVLSPRVTAAGGDKRTTVVLGDGAAWIWNLASEILPNRIEILDWYHADEHISETARVLYGESEQAGRWRAVQLERLADDGVDDVIAGLVFLGPKQRAKAKRESIDGLAEYLRNNRTRMLYKTYRSRGFHIGSGAVESSVGYVVQQRMKLNGMRWQAKGADAMLALRSVFRSDARTWSDFWTHSRRAA